MPPKSCLVSRQVFLGLQEQKRAKDSCIAKALPNLGARNALPVALHSLPVAQVHRVNLLLVGSHTPLTSPNPGGGSA